MRISDWSSDVCSSDLLQERRPDTRQWCGLSHVQTNVPLDVSIVARAAGPAKLPPRHAHMPRHPNPPPAPVDDEVVPLRLPRDGAARSDERRVGKGVGSTCRSGWSLAHSKKKTE